MKFETLATHGFIDLKKQNNAVSEKILHCSCPVNDRFYLSFAIKRSISTIKRT